MSRSLQCWPGTRRPWTIQVDTITPTVLGTCKQTVLGRCGAMAYSRSAPALPATRAPLRRYQLFALPLPTLRGVVSTGAFLAGALSQACAHLTRMHAARQLVHGESLAIGCRVGRSSRGRQGRLAT